MALCIGATLGREVLSPATLRSQRTTRFPKLMSKLDPWCLSMRAPTLPWRRPGLTLLFVTRIRHTLHLTARWLCKFTGRVSRKRNFNKYARVCRDVFTESMGYHSKSSFRWLITFWAVISVLTFAMHLRKQAIR